MPTSLISPARPKSARRSSWGDARDIIWTDAKDIIWKYPTGELAKALVSGKVWRSTKLILLHWHVVSRYSFGKMWARNTISGVRFLPNP